MVPFGLSTPASSKEGVAMRVSMPVPFVFTRYKSEFPSDASPVKVIASPGKC